MKTGPSATYQILGMCDMEWNGAQVEGSVLGAVATQHLVGAASPPPRPCLSSPRFSRKGEAHLLAQKDGGEELLLG